jgi:anti-sigma factor RsiW
MMEGNPCQSYEADYSALIDAELAPERATELRDHLEGCERCRGALEALQSVDVWLREAPAPEPSAPLREALMARIAQEQSADRPGVPRRAAAAPLRTRRFSPRGPWRRPAFAAAAGLAAAAALGVLLFRAPEPQPVAEPARAAASSQLAEVTSPVDPESPASVEVAGSATGGAEVEQSWVEAFEESDDEQAFEIALAMDLDTVQDLDVIANLELLEALLYIEEGPG